MYPNDDNHNQRPVISPLTSDSKGRFSRKGTLAVKIKPDRHDGIENVFIFLIIFCLISSNLILYADSGTLKVFDNSFFPIAEVSGIIFWIAVLSLIIVLATWKVKVLQYLLTAGIAFFITYVTFNQFAQYAKDFDLGGTSVPYNLAYATIIALLFILIFVQNNIYIKIIPTLMVISLFIYIYSISMTSTKQKSLFLEIENTQQQTSDDKQLFIYLMFPNLVSYPYFTTITDSQSETTQKIMQGFFQKHKFNVFPITIANEDNYIANMINSFHPTDDRNINSHILPTKMISEYLRFYNIRDEHINLKDNAIYDHLRENGYQISAYKSREIDICRANHQFNVNRCVEKVNNPINLANTTLSIKNRTKILFYEWLTSMKIFKDLTAFKKIIPSGEKVATMPIIGIDYKNLYVVDSPKTFDVMLDDMLHDSGKQAYIAVIDLPSNMFVYNEYCQLKDEDQWLNLANKPWISVNNKLERQQAYMQQTRCLIGKLEQMVDKIKQENLWNNIVIIIQGLSSVNNFDTSTTNNNAITFIGNKLINMAIYDEKLSPKKSLISTKLCTAKNILNEYIFAGVPCEQGKLNIHQSVALQINKYLLKLSKNIINNVVPEFDEWYEKWKEINERENNTQNIITKIKPQQFEDKEGVSDNFGKDNFGLDDL